jgi:hypothetical protein
MKFLQYVVLQLPNSSQSLRDSLCLKLEEEEGKEDLSASYLTEWTTSLLSSSFSHSLSLSMQPHAVSLTGISLSHTLTLSHRKNILHDVAKPHESSLQAHNHSPSSLSLSLLIVRTQSLSHSLSLTHSLSFSLSPPDSEETLVFATPKTVTHSSYRPNAHRFACVDSSSHDVSIAVLRAASRGVFKIGMLSSHLSKSDEIYIVTGCPESCSPSRSSHRNPYTEELSCSPLSDFPKASTYSPLLPLLLLFTFSFPLPLSFSLSLSLSYLSMWIRCMHIISTSLTSGSSFRDTFR